MKNFFEIIFFEKKNEIIFLILKILERIFIMAVFFDEIENNIFYYIKNSQLFEKFNLLLESKDFDIRKKTKYLLEKYF